jgi:hypothetical protein
LLVRQENDDGIDLLSKQTNKGLKEIFQLYFLKKMANVDTNTFLGMEKSYFGKKKIKTNLL